MRSLLCALALALMSASAPAQVIWVKFNNKNSEKRFKKYMTVYEGKTVVIGEPKAGFTLEPRNIRYTGGQGTNELYVSDPSNPAKVPYQWIKGERKDKGKSLSFSGQEVEKMGFVDRLQTLDGLAREYRQRLEDVEDLKKARDAKDKGGQEWFGGHGKVLAHYDRLGEWLLNNGYPGAAERLEKEIKKERRAVAKEAQAERERLALESVHRVDTPAKLTEVSQEITGGSVAYHVQESQHVRLTYQDSLPDERAKHLLEFAERLIEGFRKEFVDPFRSDEFEDWIPDTLFQEFYFGPADLNAHEHFFVKYYGQAWSKTHKEKQLATLGTRGRLGKQQYLDYWKMDMQEGLDGIIAHSLGHTLADLHYNKGRMNGSQPWIKEAVGYYLSFGFLGRNTVTCFNYSDPGYAKKASDEGDKTVQEGLRGYFNELALTKGPSIDALALKKLAEIDDADFAKAWSFFDFLATTEALRGQQWLRTTCSVSGAPKLFMAKWREVTEEMFEVSGEDVFRVLNDRWKEFAVARQRKD